MKLFLFQSFLILLFCACAPRKSSITNSDCNENMNFKKEFFINIENVEKKILVSQDQSFTNSLKFLSKYVHVSFESMLNYNGSYPFGIFEKDKKEWLVWYQANKCDNIQFK